MLFDSLDFDEFEMAYFNFPMVEAFPYGSDVYLSFNFTADVTGSTTFEVTIDSLESGDIYTSSTGATAKSTSVVLEPDQITKVELTMENPTYSDISPGDLVIVKVRRPSLGTLGDDLKLLSMKLFWI
jgi:hypothetical protein